MRQEFIVCNTKRAAQKSCPWASVIVKVTGGYRCFESVTDADTWKNQK